MYVANAMMAFLAKIASIVTIFVLPANSRA
jgi:hypothetical protein